MRYRRADVAGGTYFIIVNFVDRNRCPLVEHVDILRKVMRTVKITHPFHIDAMVLDHRPVGVARGRAPRLEIDKSIVATAVASLAGRKPEKFTRIRRVAVE